MGEGLRSGSVNVDGRKGRLHYFIKLPQAGGSSKANEFIRAAPAGHPRVVIGGDDFRIGTHSMEYLRTSEGLVFAQMDTATRALLYRGFDVLIDETSTTEATLLRYYLMDFDSFPIIIDTPSSECIRRARASGRDYLVPCIEQMARQKDELLKDWPNAVERVKARILERYPNDVVRS